MSGIFSQNHVAVNDSSRVIGLGGRLRRICAEQLDRRSRRADGAWAAWPSGLLSRGSGALSAATRSRSSEACCDL
jgi:hypothetical protein